MIQKARLKWSGHGIMNIEVHWGAITSESVVVVTVGEGQALGYPPITGRWLGDARMTVSNIVPYNGGVFFRVTIEWDGDLHFITDISVLGLPQVFAQPGLNWTYVYPASARSLGAANKLMTKLDRGGKKMLQEILIQEHGISGKITGSVQRPTQAKKSVRDSKQRGRKPRVKADIGDSTLGS